MALLLALARLWFHGIASRKQAGCVPVANCAAMVVVVVVLLLAVVAMVGVVAMAAMVFAMVAMVFLGLVAGDCEGGANNQ